MTLKLSDLVKDKNKIDLNDICSAWTWLIADQKNVLLVTVFGDMFLVGQLDEVNWLDCSTGELTRVADSVNEFQTLLSDKDNFRNWFLTPLYIELQQKSIFLNDNQVYSYKKMPVLGGEYITDNVEPLDISVHFTLTGQICEQIKDLPDGTPIDVVTTK